VILCNHFYSCVSSPLVKFQQELIENRLFSINSPGGARAASRFLFFFLLLVTPSGGCEDLQIGSLKLTARNGNLSRMVLMASYNSNFNIKVHFITIKLSFTAKGMVFLSLENRRLCQFSTYSPHVRGTNVHLPFSCIRELPYRQQKILRKEVSVLAAMPKRCQKSLRKLKQL
jgi:hypothetical protein